MKSPAPSRVSTASDLTQALAGVECEKELRAALASGDVAVFEMGSANPDGPLQKRKARAESVADSSKTASVKPPCPK